MPQDTKKAAEPRRSARGEVEIGAPIERVWRALTEADELERWFPLEAKVEPGAGGSIWMSWKNEYAGSSDILEWDPPRLLRTTWGEADGGGSAQITEYRLESLGKDRTLLRVVTSGFPADAAWDEWVEGTRLGWQFELRSLRQYLERHDGRDRRVAYVRRRVSLPASEAWSRLMGDDGLDARWRRGEVVSEEPGRQLALTREDPRNSLLRVSIEPCFVKPGEDKRDVTLWLSVWGDDRMAERASAVREEWQALVERLYAEGETV